MKPTLTCIGGFLLMALGACSATPPAVETLSGSRPAAAAVAAVAAKAPRGAAACPAATVCVSILSVDVVSLPSIQPMAPLTITTVTLSENPVRIPDFATSIQWTAPDGYRFVAGRGITIDDPYPGPVVPTPDPAGKEFTWQFEQTGGRFWKYSIMLQKLEGTPRFVVCDPTIANFGNSLLIDAVAATSKVTIACKSR